MKVNYHFHSRCSFDAEHPLTELCAVAQKAGLRYLCLTDHCDLVDEFGVDDDTWDWAAIDRELSEARARYPDLEICRGVELGEALMRPEPAKKVLSEPGIDFVLGSMHHTVRREDFYHLRYTDAGKCERILEEYLYCLLAMSRTDDLDSLAHLTYPMRYIRYRDGVKVDIRRFDDLIREILKNLAERGKALELNTSGYRQGMGGPMPDEYILKMYRELGGELITIGTDAHVPEHMASDLDRGEALLEACGFRYVTLYRNRKPIQMRLEDVK